MLEILLLINPVQIAGVSVSRSVLLGWCLLAVALLVLALIHKKIQSYVGAPKGIVRLVEAVVLGVSHIKKHDFRRVASAVYKKPVGRTVGLVFLVYIIFAVLIILFGKPSGNETLNVSLTPEPFYIGGVNVGLSVVTGWCALAVLLVLLVIARIRIGSFTEKPSGAFQLMLEAIVDGAHSFAKGKVGHAADFTAPVALTFVFYLLSVTLVELFGLPPATDDINCTLALGVCAFIAVNIAGFKYKGVRGRLKVLVWPTPVVAPIKVLTDFITPISMCIRLFANILVGGVIMSLIYQVAPVLLPAALSAYFSFGHVLLQVFVFALLTLIYTGEIVDV